MKQLLPLLFLLALTWTAQAQTAYPPRIYADTAHAPFLHGVASADPTASAVLLWTRVEPSPGQTAPISLDWELASDPAFAQVVASGTADATAAADWTLTVEATGLLDDRHYWYRFIDPAGKTSLVGRTHTLPAGTSPHVRLAVASCSSTYSGYFNGYRHIGQRDDIHLVVHLGDYIYDYPDPDELVRVPTPTPTQPTNLAEWRATHRYLLLDPDLRLARSKHPFTVIWDNHDVYAAPQDAQQAFHEYVPIRLKDPAQPSQIYRKISLGPLADLILLDVTTLRDLDTLPNGDLSLLGTDQWAWLNNELATSTAPWRIIGNERMVGEFSLSGLPAFIPYGDGPVADSSAWDGYSAERDLLLTTFSTLGLHNNILLSGDIHMSFACDLAPSTAAYDPQTGAGSVAVEFLPTSISRGNFDEAGFGGFLATLAQNAMALANPHHVYEELESHGYGILDIRPDRAVAEYWYADILTPLAPANFARAYQTLDGSDHWDRTALTNPSVAVLPQQPRPAHVTIDAITPILRAGTTRCDFSLPADGEVTISVIEVATGRIIFHEPPAWRTAGHNNYFLPSSVKAIGPCVLLIQDQAGAAAKIFLPF
jgi:alkaline phosphatase D